VQYGHTYLMGGVLCHPELRKDDRLEYLFCKLMAYDYGYEEVLATLDDVDHSNVVRLATLVRRPQPTIDMLQVRTDVK
jgi:hypothetical protein